MIKHLNIHALFHIRIRGTCKYKKEEDPKIRQLILRLNRKNISHSIYRSFVNNGNNYWISECKGRKRFIQ
jgi:hypothetical protein